MRRGNANARNRVSKYTFRVSLICMASHVAGGPPQRNQSGQQVICHDEGRTTIEESTVPYFSQVRIITLALPTKCSARIIRQGCTVTFRASWLTLCRLHSNVCPDEE